CIPVYPRLYLSNDPDATVVRAAREANSATPARAVERLTVEDGDLPRAREGVPGAVYRGGVKETAFSGVFETVRCLVDAGATVTVHDPLYTADELTALGFEPYTPDVVVDAAIIQTDHPDYRDLAAGDLPGVK